MKPGTLRARFFAPPDELAGCFTSFYLLEVKLETGERIADLLHPEWGNLRFFQGEPPETAQLGKDVLKGTPFTATGPSSHPVAFSLGSARMWGIGLLPLGWAKFMDVRADDMADIVSDGLRHPAFARFVPLLEQLDAGPADDAVQAAMIGAFFRTLDRPVRAERQIAAIHAALVDPELHSASGLARRAQLSQRSLERLCARYFGFSPRALIRRQRMMRTLSTYMLSPDATWSQAIDLHYADHAHFTHEFHAFMGMSPSEYAERDHPVLRTIMAERARVIGSPVQTLDAPGAKV